MEDAALRLFLIEDDPEHTLLIRKSLERAGHQVKCCRTVADALIVLANSTFDLVLLDVIFNDEKLTGFDLLHQMTQEGIVQPVLMMTMVGKAAYAVDAFKAGVIDYVFKDPAWTFLGDLPKKCSESVNRYKLEQNNQLLIQALDSTRDGVMITDLRGIILRVNNALEKLTGYAREELVGQTLEFYAHRWKMSLGREGWQGEVTNRRKDGTLYQASLTVSPIIAHGRLTHYVGIERDISEQKEIERQLLQAQKMQSVGTLAGGVAHEFNNLLAGINGYASLGLREPDISPTVSEFFQHVVDLSERAASLTRQLLAFARKPALLRRRTSIGELMRGTAEMVSRTLHLEVALELNERAADGGPLLVEADANQLQQALVNLTLNARDAVNERLARERGSAGEASTANGPPITYRLRQQLVTEALPAFSQSVQPGDYVVLEVEDRGEGMTQEVLDQAVNPFFTTKDVGQGTGLGLPMVFGIVQGHHGFLKIDTTVGKGTCVRLYLPRLLDSRDDERSRSQDRAAQVVEPECQPHCSILVIDDEESVLDVVRRFLEIAGHRVSSATSGQEGADLLAQGNPVDLIILDLMMPREDAATTFQRLRQRRPTVPILLCTGLPEADPAPELLQHDGVGLIRKPFRMNDLWYAVKEALRPSGER